MKTTRPTEAAEHKNLVIWLKLNYPNVCFNTDMSGVRLPMGLAKKVSSLRSNRAMPDLVIYEKRGNSGAMFIELKRTGEKLFKLNGQPVNNHVSEQLTVSTNLISKGYHSVICCGFEQAKKEIEKYLNEKK